MKPFWGNEPKCNIGADRANRTYAKRRAEKATGSGFPCVSKPERCKSSGEYKVAIPTVEESLDLDEMPFVCRSNEARYIFRFVNPEYVAGLARWDRLLYRR